MPEPAFLIRFYLFQPGDLGIQDTHWGGYFGEAQTWARQRLEVLRLMDRPADQLRPAVCDILDIMSEEAVYSFSFELTGVEAMAADN